MSDRKNNFDFSRQSWPKQPSAERVVGERGRKELPPGTKGGENMKPDRHAEHKQHAFDSFCKKVEVRGLQWLSRDQPQEEAQCPFQRTAGGRNGAACGL